MDRSCATGRTIARESGARPKSEAIVPQGVRDDPTLVAVAPSECGQECLYVPVGQLLGVHVAFDSRARSADDRVATNDMWRSREARPDVGGHRSATRHNGTVRIRAQRNHVKNRISSRLDTCPAPAAQRQGQPDAPEQRCTRRLPTPAGERPHPYANSSAPSTTAGTRRVPGDPSAAARSDPSCSASNPPSDHTNSVAPTVCSATECARS